MEWGVLVIALFLLLVSYVIIQETRAQLHWRGLIAGGDVSAVRQLFEDEMQGWRSARVPKGTSALLWHGVQTVELIDIAATGARLSCNADGEFALEGGRRVETSSPLAEGKKITMKLADLALYEVPNLKLERVQIDVYTSFRDESGHADTRCILSSLVRRAEVEALDWEATPAARFVEIVGGRFVPDDAGALQAVEPLAWLDEAESRS